MTLRARLFDRAHAATFLDHHHSGRVRAIRKRQSVSSIVKQVSAVKTRRTESLPDTIEDYLALGSGVVSTRAAVRFARERHPDIEHTDRELEELVLLHAIRRSRSVICDISAVPWQSGATVRTLQTNGFAGSNRRGSRRSR